MIIVVSNLPSSVNEEHVRDLFSTYGSIESVQMVNDRKSGIFMGSAVVVMPSDVEADEAIGALDGTEYRGQQIGVRQMDGPDFPSDEYW